MEKNNLENFDSKILETTDEELVMFLDIMEKQGKLETFFKVLEIITDDKIDDEIEITMDEIITNIKNIDNLETKAN